MDILYRSKFNFKPHHITFRLYITLIFIFILIDYRSTVIYVLQHILEVKSE